MNFRYIKVTLFVAFTCISSVLLGQLKTAPVASLESPYNTMTVHLYYLQTDSYDPDTAALTIAQVPGLDSATAIDIAVRIKQIFDGKGLYVRLNSIPQDPAYRDSINNEHYFTPFPTVVPEIYLERINGKWYYSRETVSLVPQLHKHLFPLGSDFLVKILPKNANQRFLGLYLWQYFGLLMIILICTLCFVIIRFVLMWAISIFSRKRENWSFVIQKDRQQTALYSSFALTTWIAKMLMPAIQLQVRGNAFMNMILDIAITLALMTLGLVLINVVSHRMKSVTEETESKMDEQLLPILNKMIKMVIVAIATIYILKLLNVNVTALIAGVSIGGLALALAAQDTVKNLIGSAMIFADKPFQIGDYIMAGGHEGTVVEVGFRSTRLMQIDTSVIAIPNGNIANMALTNLGVRDSRLFNIMIGILYETPPDKIEEFIGALRNIIAEHPLTKDDPYYVHLREFASSSINIMCRCYLNVNSFAEEAEQKEDILFKILRLAADMDVEFAYPTTMVHMAKGSDTVADK